MQDMAEMLNGMMEKYGFDDAVKWWKDTAVPGLQENLGVEVGAALAAGSLALLSVVADRGGIGKTAKAASLPAGTFRSTT